MNHQNRRRTHSVLRFAPLALFLLPALALAEPGNQMHMTTHMHVVVNNKQLPEITQTAKVCVPTNPDPRSMMSPKTQEHCKISNFRHSGHTYSYHVDCTDGDTKTSGDAKWVVTTARLSGTMHMTGHDSDSTMDSHGTSEGTRIGSCDYEPGAASNYQAEDSGHGNVFSQALGGLFKREKDNATNETQEGVQNHADKAVSNTVDKVLSNLFGK